MEGIVYQHIISYPNNSFCIEGTWKADPSNSDDDNINLIKSPPIQYQEKTFYISFNFYDSKDLFMIYIDMENISCNSFPVSIKILFKNKIPEKSLFGESKFCFTPQSNHGIINVGNFLPKQVFADEDFAPDSYFIIEFQISHEETLIEPKKLFPVHSFKIPTFNKISNNYFPRLDFANNQNEFLFNTNMLFQSVSTFDISYPFSNDFQENSCGFCGLYNQGATCYLNSMLQSLYHIPAFKSLVYQITFDSLNQQTRDNDMIYNLQKLFSEMDNHNSAVSTKDLTKSFGWTSEESFKQHDIQELLRVFLEAISQKLKHLNASKNDKNPQIYIELQPQIELPNPTNETIGNEISDLFKFQVEQLIQCPQVGFTNTRVDDYLDLTVEVRGCPNLYQSLKKFTLPEKLEEPYRTEKYGPQEAVMLNKFINLPKVLFIHLKRFEYTTNANTTNPTLGKGIFQQPTLSKINDRFEFPLVFDFGEFVDQNAAPQTTSNHQEIFNENSNIGISNENANNTELLNENTLSNVNTTLSNENENNLPNINENDQKDHSINSPNEIEQNISSESLNTKLPNDKNNLELSMANDKTNAPIQSNQTQNSPWTYGLYGVLVHSGSASCGHYFVYLRPTPENKWYKFNDSKVTECTESEAVFSNYGDGKNPTNSYMLIYMRQQDIPDLFTQTVQTPIQIIEEKVEIPKPEQKVVNANIDQNGNLFKSKIYKSPDDLKVTIYTDSDIRNYSDEFAIFSMKDDTNDDCKRFKNTGIIILPGSSTCKDLLKRIYAIYISNDSELINDDDELNSLDVWKITETETKAPIKATDDLIAEFSQSIDVFLRTSEISLKSISNTEIMPIMDIDNTIEIAVKKTFNALFSLSRFGKSIANHMKSIAYDSIQFLAKRNSNLVTESILLFLKVFDYKLQKIVYLKSIIVNKKECVSKLFEYATVFYYPNEFQTRNCFKFYKQNYRTLYTLVNTDQSFETNNIKSGCVIIIENIDEKVNPIKEIKASEPIPTDSSTFAISKEKLTDLQIKYSKSFNEPYNVLNYINDKYNICDAVVSLFDNPSKYLFILRFPFNIDIMSLKKVVAEAAGINNYDPLHNSIFLYRHYFKCVDMPAISPLTSKIHLNEPIHRLFFYFFKDVSEEMAEKLVTVKVYINQELKIFLAHPNETVQQFKQKNLIQLGLIDENYVSWLDKSSSLYQVPNEFLIRSVWDNSLRFCKPIEYDQDNQKLISVCHPQGSELFLPFVLIVHKNEKFEAIKERLFDELKKHGFSKKFEDVRISVHFLTKSNYDTNKPKSIGNEDCLFNLGQNDETPFIFIEERKSNVTSNKNGVVIK